MLTGLKINAMKRDIEMILLKVQALTLGAIISDGRVRIKYLDMIRRAAQNEIRRYVLSSVQTLLKS